MGRQYRQPIGSSRAKPRGDPPWRFCQIGSVLGEQFNGPRDQAARLIGTNIKSSFKVKLAQPDSNTTLARESP